MEGTTPRRFDLNVETVLDDWEVYHAIREVIANALDEQVLTGTPDIEITGGGTHFEIRDYGRGIRYAHLTQNENEEKLANPGRVIGKFGVGLKDALATFDRHHIGVALRSRHGDITITKSSKHGFDDVVTLHASVAPPSDPALEGTLAVLDGCTDGDMDRARRLFLKFSGETALDRTQYGDILERAAGGPARIYVNGVAAAEEDNFLFSYNITSLTGTMRKALNRERTNVGRTAYTGRVKDILLASTDKDVARRLAGTLGGYGSGTQPDEMKWVDVSTHACKIHNETTRTVFVTPAQLENNAEAVDQAKRDGMTVTVVPEAVRDKISGATDASGNEVRDLGAYREEYNKSFEYKFVEAGSLTDAERAVYDMTPRILAMARLAAGDIPVRISETMRMLATDCTAGVWDPGRGWIVIKRDVLSSAEEYAGTLLHEAAHAASGTSDMSREFEATLTLLLGRAAVAALDAQRAPEESDRPRTGFWRRGGP